MPRQYVIFSWSEARAGGGGYWSNDLGWCDHRSATVFSPEESNLMDRPGSCGGDACWIALQPKTRPFMIEAWVRREELKFETLDAFPAFADSEASAIRQFARRRPGARIERVCDVEAECGFVPTQLFVDSERPAYPAPT